MTDANQIYTFLVCVLCGVGSGIVYDLFYCVRFSFKRSWIRIASDIAFCVVFTVIYLFVSVMMGLENLRLYTFVGCILGIFLYLKGSSKRIYNCP